MFLATVSWRRREQKEKEKEVPNRSRLHTDLETRWSDDLVNTSDDGICRAIIQNTHINALRSFVNLERQSQPVCAKASRCNSVFSACRGLGCRCGPDPSVLPWLGYRRPGVPGGSGTVVMDRACAHLKLSPDSSRDGRRMMVAKWQSDS